MQMSHTPPWMAGALVRADGVWELAAFLPGGTCPFQSILKNSRHLCVIVESYCFLIETNIEGIELNRQSACSISHRQVMWLQGPAGSGA
jgi:hypothetical protein